MKKIIMGVRQGWFLMAIVCFVSFGALSTTGCAGRTKTSTVTTQTTNGVSGSGSTSSVTTQKEVTSDAHPRGVIGGLFYTLGQILLWPFKVIGSLFS